MKMTDGGPEGYQESGRLPEEKSAIKPLKLSVPSPEIPVAIRPTESQINPKMERMEPGDIKDVSYYQALTFNKLSSFMETEANKGNSKLLLDLVYYNVGDLMKDVLRKKGFNVSTSSTSRANYVVISW